VFTHLAAETEAVDAMVSGLDEAQLGLPTPAPGWTVAHQVGHLAFIFRLAGAAAADPEVFAAMTAGAEKDFDGAVNAALQPYLAESPEGLIARWQNESTDAIKALSAVDAPVVPWLVRPLPPAVLACAGMMELIGHGQDIADALGVERPLTDRIKWVCGFAVQVWDFGYLARGETPPDTAFRFELTSPSGELWEFGPEDATQKITGSAAHFVLLVTRRRHRDDTNLKAIGADADHWLDIAQAYRGSPGPGREAGQSA
jgi:uncharacterized protein (TIGR03084 family)